MENKTSNRPASHRASKRANDLHSFDSHICTQNVCVCVWVCYSFFAFSCRICTYSSSSSFLCAVVNAIVDVVVVIVFTIRLLIFFGVLFTVCTDDSDHDDGDIKAAEGLPLRQRTILYLLARHQTIVTNVFCRSNFCKVVLYSRLLRWTNARARTHRHRHHKHTLDFSRYNWWFYTTLYGSISMFVWLSWNDWAHIVVLGIRSSSRSRVIVHTQTCYIKKYFIYILYSFKNTIFARFRPFHLRVLGVVCVCRTFMFFGCTFCAMLWIRCHGKSKQQKLVKYYI